MENCGDGVLELFQGDDWTILFTLRSAQTKIPLDLTGASEISIKFKKTDGTFLTKTLTGNHITVVSAIGGKGSIAVPKVDSATVKVGELLTHFMTVTKAGKETTYRFPKNISIFAK